MKTLTSVLFVTVLVIHISGYLIHVPTVPHFAQQETVPVQWLHVQKLIIPLFENVCEESNNPVIRRLSEEFVMTPDDYLKPDVMTDLKTLVSSGLLPKGEIFSEYNPDHLKEWKIVYDVLYNAKTFDTFYKTAAWARQRLNCGLYVNAIYMAIQNRRDTERLSIPAPYELLPNYFIQKDVIFKASTILAGMDFVTSDSVRDEGNAYFIDANYTAIFYDNYDDSKLAYFREDIGLNAYYFLKKLKLAPWTNEDINSKYGEIMFQMMKQLNARYNLERYANGLPELEDLDWNALSNIPYDPMLVYSDGNDFNHRTSALDMSSNEDLSLLQTIENNIVAVVSHMRQSGYNKTQILNHLMEILVTGDRSYETLARQLLGKDVTNNGHTSVLEHYMTSLRDPMFWIINKKIVDLTDSALKMLPAYSRSELYFPGVEVVNIDVKKMMTAYDYFVFDVTEALKIEGSNSTFNVNIGQPRLNHKPFTIKVNISSIVSKKGLVKIYLGPKLPPSEIITKKNFFTLLDIFEVNLKIGTNIVTRSSDDMRQFSSDFMSLKTIHKKVLDAEFGLDSLPLSTIESQTGYPSRLILPKGSPLGLPVQIFVFVAPYTKAILSESYPINSMEFNSAILSPGYPLDLNIEDKQLFTLPNVMIKYFTITQKGDKKVENYGGPGITKQWYGASTYDPSSRPSYSGGNKKPYDYASKKSETEYKDEVKEETNGNTLFVPKQDMIENKDEKIERQLVDNVEETKYYTPKINEYNVATHDIDEFDYEENAVTRIPHFLKSSKFDYTSKNKRKEPYTEKKNDQLEGKDDSTKIQDSNDFNNDDSHLKAIQAEKESIPEYMLPKDKSSVRLNKKYFEYKDKVKVVKKYSSDKSEDSIKHAVMPLIDEELVSDSENQDSLKYDFVPRLLKASSYDYKAKRKEFDYKAKKAEFNKKDFSTKRGDYSKYGTGKPKDEEVTTTSPVTILEPSDEIARVILNKDVTNVDLVNVGVTEKNDNLVVKYNDDIVKNVDVDNFKDENIPNIFPVTVPVKKRTPTVYDFLFHPFDYDSSEWKVYE